LQQLGGLTKGGLRIVLQAGTSSAEELNEAHKRVDHYNAWALDAEVFTIERAALAGSLSVQDGKQALS
jgi:3-hydroxyisobutyrate dehydrogenase-like beta-hydroxyacid dehydrogenase